MSLCTEASLQELRQKVHLEIQSWQQPKSVSSRSFDDLRSLRERLQNIVWQSQLLFHGIREVKAITSYINIPDPDSTVAENAEVLSALFATIQGLESSSDSHKCSDEPINEYYEQMISLFQIATNCRNRLLAAANKSLDAIHANSHFGHSSDARPCILFLERVYAIYQNSLFFALTPIYELATRQTTLQGNITSLSQYFMVLLEQSLSVQLDTSPVKQRLILLKAEAFQMEREIFEICKIIASKMSKYDCMEIVGKIWLEIIGNATLIASQLSLLEYRLGLPVDIAVMTWSLEQMNKQTAVAAPLNALNLQITQQSITEAKSQLNALQREANAFSCSIKSLGRRVNLSLDPNSNERALRSHIHMSAGSEEIFAYLAKLIPDSYKIFIEKAGAFATAYGEEQETHKAQTQKALNRVAVSWFVFQLHLELIRGRLLIAEAQFIHSGLDSIIRRARDKRKEITTPGHQNEIDAAFNELQTSFTVMDDNALLSAIEQLQGVIAERKFQLAEITVSTLQNAHLFCLSEQNTGEVLSDLRVACHEFPSQFAIVQLQLETHANNLKASLETAKTKLARLRCYNNATGEYPWETTYLVRRYFKDHTPTQIVTSAFTMLSSRIHAIGATLGNIYSWYRKR